MGKRKNITTRDIAQYTGLSQATVSMILSQKQNVSFSSQTRKIVQQAARDLGYQMQTRHKEKGKTDLHHTLIVLAPLLSNGYYSTLIHSITTEARKHDYTVFTITTMRKGENEDFYYSLLSHLQIAGIIYLYPPARIQVANALARQIPVVSIGDKPKGSRFDSVELNGIRAGHLMGEYLWSLGHQKITFISAPIVEREISRLHRYQGLKQAFKEHGQSDQAISLKTISQSRYETLSMENAEYQVGFTLAMEALQENTPSTAFVANNDMTALGVMAALQSEGYRIPRDFSVAGFDNILLSGLPGISLTSIEHATALKGKEAVDIIHRKNQDSSLHTQHPYILRLEYEPELIIRKSTGKARKHSI